MHDWLNPMRGMHAFRREGSALVQSAHPQSKREHGNAKVEWTLLGIRGRPS